jgi:FkbM family methyltransferase
MVTDMQEETGKMGKAHRWLKSRLGGYTYKKLKKHLRLMKYSGHPQTDLSIFITKFCKQSSKEFFLVGKAERNARNASSRQMYEYLCNHYTSSSDDTLFDFNDVIIPKPIREDDIFIFVGEFWDILMYRLIEDKSFCDIICDDGPYESGNVVIDDGDIVFDCGANMGMFSAIASRKGANIYAFEPFEYIIDTYLSKTAKLNPNINICKYAVSEADGQVGFTGDINSIHSNKISSICDNELNQSKEQVSDVLVQAVSLDSFVQKNNIPQVDFIKADIEGAERNMLVGAKLTLKEFAPKLSLCTYHLPDDSKVFKKLILEANPNYTIEERFSKMYAYVK